MSKTKAVIYILLSIFLLKCGTGEYSLIPLINQKIQIYSVTELPPAKIYISFSFINFNIGWVLCDSNLVYHTVDGGENWEKQVCDADSQLLKIKFASAKKGWILGTGSVFRTDNSGENWDLMYTNDEITQFEKMDFVNETTGWITYSHYGKLLHTNDGGNNWTVQETGLPLKVVDISFINSNVEYAIDAVSSVASTNDGGKIWMMKTKVHWPFSIFFLNDRTGFVGNYTLLSSTFMPANIFRTDDYGNSWDTLEIPYCEVVWKIKFFDSFHGMALTSNFDSNPQIIYTTNGGGIWKVYSELDNYPMDFITVDNKYLCILCASGKIYNIYFD